MTYAELVHFNCNFKLAHTTFGYMYNQPSDHRQSLYEAGISNVSPYSSYCIFIQIPIKYYQNGHKEANLLYFFNDFLSFTCMVQTNNNLLLSFKKNHYV